MFEMGIQWRIWPVIADVTMVINLRDGISCTLFLFCFTVLSMRFAFVGTQSNDAAIMMRMPNESISGSQLSQDSGEQDISPLS